MKGLQMMTALSCPFAAQTLHAFADALDDADTAVQPVR